MELLKKSNATAAQLKGLIEKKILIAEKRATDRIKSLSPKINIDFVLSTAQQKALSEIQEQFTEKNVCLLHGVTSSGKTQIYIQLIEQYLQQGKQVLYMLPEIALTAQIIRRLQKHFGGYIAIYHSKFNPNERVEIWNKIKTGETKIVSQLASTSATRTVATSPDVIGGKRLAAAMIDHKQRTGKALTKDNVLQFASSIAQQEGTDIDSVIRQASIAARGRSQQLRVVPQMSQGRRALSAMDIISPAAEIAQTVAEYDFGETVGRSEEHTSELQSH